MLPAAHRVTDAASFREATRRGRRASGRTVVTHLLLEAPSVTGPGVSSARVGFVVSKAVGNAVVRNRVRRRLRHLVAARFDCLPAGAVVVVRALPAAAASPGAQLAADLDSCLRRLSLLRPEVLV
ncbi:ribonuclease P protein component [Nocardioides rubriscoriae]|uniref:ribonuclease P protein component n=1 Tax=Nocardioides rubriscoriae TaxID=642762 RepID=UPI0011E004BF|nr:ribonuclease P protein component [Nocardioides rubriscoriae]